MVKKKKRVKSHTYVYVYVYKITNIKNNKCYVGSTKNIQDRWKCHYRSLCGNKLKNKLQNAWNKYGKENFIFEIIEVCKLGKRFEREQYWIDKLDSYKNGYNMSRNAVSPLLANGPWNKGKKTGPLSKTHRRKISLANKGNKVSNEARVKISNSLKGVVPWNKGKLTGIKSMSFLGKVHSEEWKANMKDYVKNRERDKYGRFIKK